MRDCLQICTIHCVLVYGWANVEFLTLAGAACVHCSPEEWRWGAASCYDRIEADLRVHSKVLRKGLRGLQAPDVIVGTLHSSVNICGLCNVLACELTVMCAL